MNIYESMNAVMVDCGFVGKDSKNQQQGYKFRGIDAVMNALNPALRKNKVFVVPTVLSQEREERTTAKGGLLIYSIVTCKYTFYAEDGSFVESVVIGEGMDSGDKATNKAMSAAFKYACFQAFCIPTEEMRDSEDDSPEPIPKTPKERAAAAYPSRDEMLAFCASAYDSENIVKILTHYRVTSLGELTDTQLQSVYNHKVNAKKVIEDAS